jgi:hypothetical protein
MRYGRSCSGVYDDQNIRLAASDKEPVIYFIQRDGHVFCSHTEFPSIHNLALVQIEYKYLTLRRVINIAAWAR